MKLVRTFGRGKAAAHALDRNPGAAWCREHGPRRAGSAAHSCGGSKRRGSSLAEVCGQSSMGLTKGQALLVSREEMRAAWEGTAPELQAAMMVARGNILAFAEAQMPSEWTISPVAGVKTGQIVRPLGKRRLLCAGRTVSAAFDAADDCYSSSGGGGEADCGLFPKAGEGDFGSCVARGRYRVLSCGRSAGYRGDGVWHGYD